MEVHMSDSVYKVITLVGRVVTLNEIWPILMLV